MTRAFDLTVPADFNVAYDVVDRWGDGQSKQGTRWAGGLAGAALPGGAR